MGFQFQHRRFHCDVERELGNASIRKMIACFIGKHGGNGVDTAAHIFFDKSLTDTAPATPGRISARTKGQNLGARALNYGRRVQRSPERGLRPSTADPSC